MSLILPPPYHIAETKLTKYLLVSLPKNDKSNYLTGAGYSLANLSKLSQDLIALVQHTEAVLERTSRYGMSYSVTGQLISPSRRPIWVKTIWMRDADEEITKFITLYPPN
ncbi:DUF6883 domain-containing protein [Spirosoma taeanense]|uniref:DUF6883 domain-containing protein n=1 Tax=Spirosoma taeanense TaxID=2735870 RepID=UPI0037425CDF